MGANHIRRDPGHAEHPLSAASDAPIGSTLAVAVRRHAEDTTRIPLPRVPDTCWPTRLGIRLGLAAIGLAMPTAARWAAAHRSQTQVTAPLVAAEA
jgi:hypothetical protein